MFLEPTTLTSAALVMTETVEQQYGIETKPLLEKLGLDPALMDKPGARYPTAKMRELWSSLAQATGDPCVGLTIGARVKTTSFHALGFAWLASSSILEELQRLQRYFKVISSVPVDIRLLDTGTTYRFEIRASEGDQQSPPEAIDAFFMAIVRLSRLTRDNHFSPTHVGFVAKAKAQHLSRYIEAFSAPVEMGAEVDYIEFDKAECEATLPGKNIDLAIANERVLDNYMQALDPDKVSAQVKELLIALMPSGHASQEEVARKMHRSLSTLQRQLSGEGKNFKDIRDEIRRSMAEQYIEEGSYSLSQIAFLLGFSDQSNFSRAFKRWTGITPSEYRPNSIALQS
jgi:AraC-like DNA-binding protein